MPRSTNGSAWRVLYIAPNESWALMIKDMLEQDGFLVMLRGGGVPQMGPSAPYEVLVPEVEIREAHDALSEVLVQIPQRRPDSTSGGDASPTEPAKES